MKIQQKTINILALFLVMACLVPVTNALPENQSGIAPQYTDIRQPPVLVFDHLSELKSAEIKQDYRNRYSGIKNFTGIKNYDIFRIDITQLRQQLESGEEIPIHLEGIPYRIIPNRSTTLPSGKEKASTFHGTLADSSGIIKANFSVEIYIAEPRIIGKICDPGSDSYYFIDPLFTNQSGKVLYWAYTPKPGLHSQFQIPDDGIIFFNGEGKTASELTPEEVELLIRSQQERAQNESTAIPYPTTAKASPIPGEIIILTFLVLIGSGVTRRD